MSRRRTQYSGKVVEAYIYSDEKGISKKAGRRTKND